MVTVLVKKKDGGIPFEGPVVFTRDYVTYCSLCKKTYPQGTSGVVTHVDKGLFGRITHVDVRLPEGEFVRGVPIDYFKA